MSIALSCVAAFSDFWSSADGAVFIVVDKIQTAEAAASLL